MTYQWHGFKHTSLKCKVSWQLATVIESSNVCLHNLKTNFLAVSAQNKTKRLY